MMFYFKREQFDFLSIILNSHDIKIKIKTKTKNIHTFPITIIVCFIHLRETKSNNVLLKKLF